MAGAVVRRAAESRPILGVCGGYQMLAGDIHDDVESKQGLVPGLGLLPTTVHFGADKLLDRPNGVAYGHAVEGYEIRHGRVTVAGGDAFLDGCSVGASGDELARHF